MCCSSDVDSTINYKNIELSDSESEPETSEQTANSNKKDSYVATVTIRRSKKDEDEIKDEMGVQTNPMTASAITFVDLLAPLASVPVIWNDITGIELLKQTMSQIT